MAFIAKGKARLVSRNQNDLTAHIPNCKCYPSFIKAETAILDGEIAALDEAGTFLFQPDAAAHGNPGGWTATVRGTKFPCCITFSICSILTATICDAFRWRSAKTFSRKLPTRSGPASLLRPFRPWQSSIRCCKTKRTGGILAKRRDSCYEERRSREWLKIKITQTLIASLVATPILKARDTSDRWCLGLYNKKGEPIHVGQAGTGFNQRDAEEHLEGIAQTGRRIAVPFPMELDALRTAHWVRPELVAEIKFSEWRAMPLPKAAERSLGPPVFIGLREDKHPRNVFFNRRQGLSGRRVICRGSNLLLCCFFCEIHRRANDSNYPGSAHAVCRIHLAK